MLAGVKTLKWLDLTGTAVTPAGLQSFKSANPPCTVIFDKLPPEPKKMDRRGGE